MPEPQSPGGVERHRFDQLNPELNHGTQHTGMCRAAPRLYSLNSLQTLRTPALDAYCSRAT